jgi:hypothetical protein
MYLCTYVNEEGEGGDGEGPVAELGNICQVGLREPMHLCTCVSEEGGDGEGAGSEAPEFSLKSFFFSRWNSVVQEGFV